MAKYTPLSILEQVMTLGHVRLFRNIGKEDDCITRVAAGDPALPISARNHHYDIPETFNVEGKTLRGADYDKYLVMGNSMLPKGIHNGNYLLVKKNEENTYQMGDFLIIRVDNDYYKKYNPQTVIYDYKLRMALMRISANMSAAQIIEELKYTHFEINIESNQKYMSGKYKKARQAYPNEELVLSTTYHDGRLCYSFHPMQLILGKASIMVDLRKESPIYKFL